MQDLGKFYIKMGKYGDIYGAAKRAAQMLFLNYTLNLNAYKCKVRSREKNNEK